MPRAIYAQGQSLSVVRMVGQVAVLDFAKEFEELAVNG